MLAHFVHWAAVGQEATGVVADKLLVFVKIEFHRGMSIFLARISALHGATFSPLCGQPDRPSGY